MKKKNIVLVIVSVLVLAFCLCACQKKDPAPETQKPSEAASIEEQTTAGGETPAGTEIDAKAIAKELIGAMNKMDILSSGAISVDNDITYSEDGVHVYSLVTDPEFQNFGDLSMFFLKYCTQDYLNNTVYGELINPSEGEIPQYLYINGEDVPDGLYMVQGGKGFPNYDENSKVTISNLSDSGFTFSFNYDGLFKAEIVVDVVKDGEDWKIANVTRNME